MRVGEGGGVLGGGGGGEGGRRGEGVGGRGITRGREELLLVFDDGRRLVYHLLRGHQRLWEEDGNSSILLHMTAAVAVTT